MFAYSPGIVRLDSGRLIATLDLGGPGMKDWPEPKGRRGSELVQGKVFTSDDGGLTWTHRTDFPFFHATPFVAGESLYVLGHAGDLMIIRSNDHGATWSEVAKLTKGQFWTGHAHNICYENGCVYIPMERYTRGRIAWSELAPVLLRGRVNADLRQLENWTFASELVFNETVNQVNLDFVGIPFFNAGQVSAPATDGAARLAGNQRRAVHRPRSSLVRPDGRPSTSGCAPTPAAPAMPASPRSSSREKNPAPAQ